MDYNGALALLKREGQEHLLAYWDELSDEQKSSLLNQIAATDFSCFENLGEVTRTIGDLSPVPAVTAAEAEARKEEFKEAGISLLKQGKVGAVLLAGGQGTRLGSDKPKGMFDMGVTRSLSIFACQFANIMQVVQKAGRFFHIFVMTSVINDADTRQFFKQQNFFGYPEDKVHFFVQDMAATCDFNGKVFLEEKWKISSSPNGNGGWYVSLVGSPVGKIVKQEGIEWLNVYSVDNVLQRICDPVFIGATILSGAGCSSKVVRKVAPEERVGVLCMEDGKPAIVEYYEMPADLAAERDEEGNLKYAYGVTLNYLFRVDLLDETVRSKLPVHLSKKKIPHIEGGVRVSPSEPNGYKFELLVLDMIKLMGSCLAVEVVREREFAPVKNRTGTDSVDTARELLRLNGVQL